MSTKPTFHLYYRLPYTNAAVGKRDEPLYQILRSDTETWVCSACSQSHAERICAQFKRDGKLPKRSAILPHGALSA